MIDKSILLDNKKFTLGVFDDSDKLIHAVETLRKKGIKIFDCYTPFPVHNLDKALGYERTNLTIGAFLCGMLGSLSGFSLAYYMNVVDWPMIVGGKPNDLGMFTSFIPIIFELTILFTAFGMVIMFFARSRMIHGIKEDLLNVRQTNDKLVLAIDNAENVDFTNADIISLLKNEGAVEIQNNSEAFNTSHSDFSASNPPVAQLVDNASTITKESTTENTEIKTEVETKKVLSAEEKGLKLDLIKNILGEAVEGVKDDLKLISGVGPKYEETLNGIGIFTFEQVSKMTPATIEAIEEITNYFPGRIERDDWIGQAKKLMNK
jgi:predicted flap endonuclease-1-like 5' DNA nuclease